MTIPCRRILVVTADAALRHAIAEQFELIEGSEPLPCGSAGEALAILDSGPVDAVIADTDLPEATADPFCRELRRRGLAAPVLMLVPSDGAPAPEAAGHVVKPFRLGTLIARVNELVERAERRETRPVAVGPATFHPGSRTLVRRDGTRLRLTEKEARILAELHHAGGEAVDRGVLLDRVWGYDERIETHTLETHIWRLRRKIERDPSNARILLTAPGGYRLAR